MKQVILPTDFSDNSWKAMCYAADLYHNIPCRFHIINTFSIPTSTSEVGVLMPIEPLQEESEEKLKAISKQFKELDHHDLSDCDEQSICGPLVNALQKIESSFLADTIIVMGTRGATGFGELFFGTLTASTIKHLKSPVICVPDSALLQTPKSVMLSLDNDGVANKAELQPVLDLANSWGSEIKIVNVDSENIFVKESKERIVLDEYFAGSKHSFHSIDGSYKEDELKLFSKTNKVDLITMIRRDKGFWGNFFHKSLTENMALYSNIPLLVMRG